jgi:hypothetical protein
MAKRKQPSGLQGLQDLSGLNYAVHQVPMLYLAMGITQRLQQAGSAYIATTETVIKHDALPKKLVIPDVCVWNPADTADNAVLIIEIARTKATFKSDIAKVQMCLGIVPTVQEGFVFNYVSGAWCRVQKHHEPEPEVSYSLLLERDLADYVR